MRKTIVMLGLVMGLLVATTGRATPLNLSLNSEPDIFAGMITVDFDSTFDAFSATGFSQQFNGTNLTTMGVFSLTAEIDDAGALTNGLLSVGGTIDSLGFISDTLLTGTITDFGFGGAGDPLEFLFTATGGDAMGLYSGLGGIILSGTGFGGTFIDNFGSGGSTAVADIGVVPIPAAVWLFGSALLGLVGYNRRRKTG